MDSLNKTLAHYESLGTPYVKTISFGVATLKQGTIVLGGVSYDLATIQACNQNDQNTFAYNLCEAINASLKTLQHRHQQQVPNAACFARPLTDGVVLIGRVPNDDFSVDVAGWTGATSSTLVTGTAGSLSDTFGEPTDEPLPDGTQTDATAASVITLLKSIVNNTEDIEVTLENNGTIEMAVDDLEAYIGATSVSAALAGGVGSLSAKLRHMSERLGTTGEAANSDGSQAAQLKAVWEDTDAIRGKVATAAKQNDLYALVSLAKITLDTLEAKAATEAKQDTGNNTLSSIDSKVATATKQDTIISNLAALLAKTKSNDSLLVDDFSSLTGWSKIGTGGALALDTSKNLVGSGAIKADKSAAGFEFGIEKTISSVDFSSLINSDSYFNLGLYIDDVIDSSYDGVILRIGTDSSNYRQWSLTDSSLKQFWNDLFFDLTSDLASEVGTGWNPSAVTYIAVVLDFSSEVVAGDFYFDSLYLATGSKGVDSASTEAKQDTQITRLGTNGVAASTTGSQAAQLRHLAESLVTANKRAFGNTTASSVYAVASTGNKSFTFHGIQVIDPVQVSLATLTNMTGDALTGVSLGRGYHPIAGTAINFKAVGLAYLMGD